MDLSSIPPNLKLDKEQKKYYNFVHMAIRCQNIVAVEREARLYQINKSYFTDDNLKNHKFVVAHTRGDDKHIDDISTDYGYKGKYGLKERCNLLLKFSKAMGENEPLYEGSTTRYTQELDKEKNTCKIFRNTTF